NAVFLSIIGAFSFSCGVTFGRRAVTYVSDAALGIMITVPLAVPFFMLILIFTGESGSIFSFSWQSYLWLSAAGVFIFILGRSLNLKSVQLIGANTTAVLLRVNPLVSVILGISLLGEIVTWELAVGALLIVFGVMLVGVNPQTFRSGKNMFSGIPSRAYIYGIGCGLARGVSPIMIKMGLSGSESPVAGVFISFLAATIVLSISLLSSSRREALARMTGRATSFFILMGLGGIGGQLMNFLALDIAPVSLVAPIFALEPVFLLGLSYLFNRKLEVFSKNVIIGIITAVVGTILLV
ncbi:EamA family transporter, partial [Chloroflexota bacterium]